jgi:hypothetical protein
MEDRAERTEAERTEHIKALMGERVTVTNPDVSGASWTGTLTGRYDEPVLVLEMPDGSSRALPQRFTLAPAEPDGKPGDEEILARLQDELPEIAEMVVEVSRPACVNCQACVALADMRAALRCVLLPWLEEQAEPATARRLRNDFETRLDELEDLIDGVCEAGG